MLTLEAPEDLCPTESRADVYAGVAALTTVSYLFLELPASSVNARKSTAIAVKVHTIMQP